MTVQLEVPDDILAALASPGQDPARLLLELSLAEAYRKGLAGSEYLSTELGFTTEKELHAFFDCHQIENLTPADFEKQMLLMDRIVAERIRTSLT